MAPTVNQIIHLASHAILGDKRLPCEQVYQDIDIAKIRDIVAQGNFNNLAHANCPTNRCRKCYQTYTDISGHLSQGQFATTLDSTWDDIMSRYAPNLLYFYPFNSERISNKQLKELRNTGEHVPANPQHP